MSVQVLEDKPKRRGRPPGSKNKPGAAKPGPKPKAMKSLPIPGAKVAKLEGHKVQRRVDLPGSEDGLDLTKFGGRLAATRIAAGLSQEKLGQAIDRCRQTVVSYETNVSFPSFDVIERLAIRLGVSATYLMFGEHAVKMPVGSDIVHLDEISYGRDGSYVSGSLVLPRKMVDSYTEDMRGLKVYVLNHNAPLFNLLAGDRLFVDTHVEDMSLEHDSYLIEVGGEMMLVRYTPSSGASVSVLNPTGDTLKLRSNGYKLIGALVSSISRH